MSPLVEPERPLYFAIEFQPQELTCSAMGVPAPAITFSRDGMVLGDGSLDGRVSLRDTVSILNDTTRVYEVNRTLEILSPVGSDTGLYACQASIEVLNLTLTDNVTFTLIVQGMIHIDLFSLASYVLFIYIHIHIHTHLILSSSHPLLSLHSCTRD